MNNLVGDVKANPGNLIGTAIVRERHPRYPPFKKRGTEAGSPNRNSSRRVNFSNGQFTDEFTTTEHNQIPLLGRSVPFIEEIVVTKDSKK